MIRKMFHFQVMGRHSSGKKFHLTIRMCVVTPYAHSKHEKQVSHHNTSVYGALSVLHIHVFMKQGHKDIKKIKRSIGVSAYRHMTTDNQLHSQSFSQHENLDSSQINNLNIPERAALRL